MADYYSKAQRSRIMARIKSKGSYLERQFTASLLSSGIRNIKLNYSKVLGTPDIAIPKYKVAIFVDSCFWHGCKLHCRMPRTNKAYWLEKIEYNRRKDRRVKKQLSSTGWTVLRIWEHSISNSRSNKWWLARIRTLTTKSN